MSHYPSLAVLLDNFVPKDAAEAAVFERLVRFYREHGEMTLSAEIVGEQGHITAQALIENENHTKVLLVFGAKESRWKLPGAHVESSPVETAIHEASRALGRAVHSVPEGIFSIGESRVPEYWNTPEHSHFELTFRFVTEEIVDTPRGARWFNSEALNSLYEELRNAQGV